MAVYKVNWEDSDHGNSLKSGDDLEVEIAGAQFISGGVYKEGALVMPVWGFGDKATAILKVRDRTPDGQWFTRGFVEGTYTLKIRAHIPNSGQYMNGWDDDFYITAN